MRTTTCAAASLAALFVIASTTFAQTAASNIVGCVLDPTGATVFGTRIDVRNLETGVEHSALSNEDGYYSLLLLSPGLYRIAVQKDGFRPMVRSRIRLEVNQTLKLDIALTLGSVSETVQVTGDEPLLQRATTELGTVVDSKAILDLPLNGRDFQQLLSLTAGVNGRSVNGQWGSGNLFHLDGVNNTGVISPVAALAPILDTIQEFKVQSHNDKAEYGGVLGGIVNVVSKSGTNDLHGAAWEFVRNDLFDARNPFNDALRAGPPAFRQNQFGGMLGGPVFIPRIYNGLNQTFFNFGYEGYRYRRPVSAFSRVPTPAELNGDFSQLGRAIFDPSTGRMSAGQYVRDPFPGNVIPAQRISSMMRAAFGLLFDRPNYTQDSFFNRQNDLKFADTRDSYTMKIDHHSSEKDSFWLRYSQSDEWRLSKQTESITVPWTTSGKNFALGWDHVISSSLIVDTRFAHASNPTQSRDVWGSVSAGRYGDLRAIVGAGFSQDKVNRFAVPDIVIGAPWSSPGIAGDSVQDGSRPYSISESIFLTRNKHSLQAGFQLIRTTFANIGRGHHVFFSDAQTGDPSQVGQTGASMASALLGLPASIAYTSGEYIEQFATWSAYLQDEWKVARSVSLNWGVRYDQFPSPHFIQGVVNVWDFKTGDWLIGGGTLPSSCQSSGSAPCIPGDGSLGSLPYGNHIRLADYPGIRHPIHDNFGPRVGIAWSLVRNTVLRAGYGLFFDTFSGTAQDMQNPANTWPNAIDIQRTFNAVGQPPSSLDKIEQDPMPRIPALSPWDTATWFWDPAKKNAYSHQWHVELQRQFSTQLMASVAYVGSASSRLDMIIAANSARNPGPGSPDEVQARKPFPYMTTTQYGTDWGQGSYSALQAKIQRMYGNGFQFLMAYTWSKSIDNGASAWFTKGPQDAYHANDSRGVSDYDRSHVLVFSGIYELPLGPTKRWLNRGIKSRVLGAWQFNTITTLQSGVPFDLVVTGDVANVGNTIRNYARPNLVGRPEPSIQSNSLWYNPSAFAVPSFSYGNFGRNVLRGAPAYNCDFSLFKLVDFSERLRGELRLEAFNAFNLMNPGLPETNIQNANAGRISSIFGRPRELQIAVKLSF